MTDDVAQLLQSLRLKKMAELVDAEVQHAEHQQLSYQDFLARLLRAQWQAQQENALAWRIQRAGLPEQWTLESFPFKRQPGVNPKQIRTFAELEFIPRAENIVFVGPTGVGKTGLASGLLLKALQNGHRGIFMFASTAMGPAADLLDGRRDKPALDQIEPRGSRRSEVDMEARTLRRPPVNERGLCVPQLSRMR